MGVGIAERSRLGLAEQEWEVEGHPAARLSSETAFEILTLLGLRPGAG